MKMSLEQKVMVGMKLAMKTKQTNDLRALRAVKAAIILAKTEKDAPKIMSEEKEIAILQKMIKQRKESAAIFKNLSLIL